MIYVDNSEFVEAYKQRTAIDPEEAREHVWQFGFKCLDTLFVCVEEDWPQSSFCIRVLPKPEQNTHTAYDNRQYTSVYRVAWRSDHVESTIVFDVLTQEEET